MPPRTFVTLLAVVLLLAAVTVGVVAVFRDDVTPWIGTIVLALLGLKLWLARRWPGTGKEEK